MISRRQAFATLASLLPAGSLSAADSEKLEEGELVKLLADALQHLRLTSPPIGSVQAFAGDWPPRKPDGFWTELDIGWLLCDGRKLDDVQKKLHEELEKQKKKIPEDGVLASLYKVLPQQGEKPAETLPNYCGMFLRGVDLRRDGTTTGNDKLDEENRLRVVGSVQQCATKLPQKKFTAVIAGKHKHALQLEMHASRNPNGKCANTVASGDPKLVQPHDIEETGNHTHNIEGGDKETRPINIAVNYIIKFQ
jgi:hypothetical protein